MILTDVFDDSRGRMLENLGMREDVSHGLKELSVITPVADAFIESELRVEVLVIDRFTVPVKLLDVALRAEGDAHGQSAE